MTVGAVPAALSRESALSGGVEDCFDEQADVRSSMPVMASPRLTGAWSARLAARRSILRSPPELGSSPASRALIAAAQSMLASSTPGSVMLVPVRGSVGLGR